MSYRCGVCQTVVKPHQPRRTRLVMRDVVRKDFDGEKIVEVVRKEISREVPVCSHCFGMLGLGCTFEELVKQRGKARPSESVVVEVKQPEIEVKVVNKPAPLRPVRLMGVPVTTG